MIPITYAPLTLELRTTFRIAHGASDQRHNVLVRVAEGVGEAAAVAYHGETQAGIMSYLESLGGFDDDPMLGEALEESLGALGCHEGGNRMVAGGGCAGARLV